MPLDHVSVLLDAGDHAKARERLSLIILSGEADSLARSYALRGWSWFQEKQYSYALADFCKAVAIQPDAGNTLYMRARCHEELNNPTAALVDYQSVIRLNPKTADAWEGAGLIHRYFGRIREAEECFTGAALAREPA